MSSPPFRKFGWRFNPPPPSRKGRRVVHTMSLQLHVNGLDSSNYLYATKDIFLEIFQNLLLYKPCCFNQTTSVYRPLSGKHPTILENSKETSVLESVCSKVRYSGCGPVTLEKKWHFCKECFQNFQNFRTSFPFLDLLEIYQ